MVTLRERLSYGPLRRVIAALGREDGSAQAILLEAAITAWNLVGRDEKDNVGPLPISRASIDSARPGGGHHRGGG